MVQTWTASGWRTKPRIQMPEYPDAGQLKHVEQQLSALPPLVFAGEVRKLQRKIALVSEGKAFLLQGRRLRRELH